MLIAAKATYTNKRVYGRMKKTNKKKGPHVSKQEQPNTGHSSLRDWAVDHWTVVLAGLEAVRGMGQPGSTR